MEAVHRALSFGWMAWRSRYDPAPDSPIAVLISDLKSDVTNSSRWWGRPAAASRPCCGWSRACCYPANVSRQRLLQTGQRATRRGRAASCSEADPGCLWTELRKNVAVPGSNHSSAVMAGTVSSAPHELLAMGSHWDAFARGKCRMELSWRHARAGRIVRALLPHPGHVTVEEKPLRHGC